MKLERFTLVLVAAIAGSAVLAGCKKKEEPMPAPIAEAAPAPTAATSAMPAAASVNGVELGNAIGNDMRVTTVMTSFAPTDTIYVAVSTGASVPAATITGTLGATWAQVGSNQALHQETKEFSFTGDGVTSFHISNPDGWPAGMYKVEISLNGNLVQTRQFEVK